MAENEIKLKVAEAIQDDINKGIVRIDSGFMQQAGIRPEDIVEIGGERVTVAMAYRAYPGDIGLNIIRMDGIIRRNAKTGIGEIVKVKKATIKEAKKVIIAPAKKGVMIRAPSEIFKQALLGRAVVKGDIVALGGTKRRRITDTALFDQMDIFNMIDESMVGFGFGDLKFLVAETNPKQAVVITEGSEVVFNPEAEEIEEYEGVPEIAYEDIGGLDTEIKKIREMVELPLKHPEIFERLGIEPPKGVLLHGPPGTGKTLLAKAIANETNSHFIVINGPEIMSKYYGQSEENLRKKFEEAEKNAPSIIFIDEIDAIASKREETRGEVERRVVAQMLALMDGLKSRGKVVVVAATNVPNILDPALRRPGRFDREIEIGVPNKEDRLKILKIHTRNMPIDTKLEDYDKNLKLDKLKEMFSERVKSISAMDLLKTIANAKERETSEMVREYVKVTFQKIKKGLPDQFYDKLVALLTDEITNLLPYQVKEEIDTKTEKQLSDKLTAIKEKADDFVRRIVKELILTDVSEKTYGFVGADLASLAKESAMIVLRRVLPDLRLEEEEAIPKELLEQLKITKEDFYEALKIVRPSALREVLIEIPNIKWGDIGGLDEVKQELKEAVEWPLKYPDAFTRMGVRPPKGILLYGAPGTGKTLLAKAVAAEAQSNFILVKGPELLSKWVGESEKAVREIFKKARQTSPTIIFFDEVDSLAPRRGMTEDNHVTERVVNQLLTEIDGVEEMRDVVVIAATNRPDIIDPALLRPGRFDRLILVPAPDKKTREDILKVHTKGMPLKNVDIKEIANKTEGYAGADIESLCREAAILALRKDMAAKEITMKNFDDALEKVPPSITKDIEKAYDELRSSLTSAKAKQMMQEKPVYMG